ncbi:hypothetical protein DM02DRAFT_559880 [Periconia macrospinosa]|uniref:DUF300-domain-containing protein n=1 Tax=Periconia macrospinosa TaxID=97972 RepID=A0A2V1DWA0_9PLEO|nr:hypothetical protein DM02DRAFT_559880 [Periconia macrospinosa]
MNAVLLLARSRHDDDDTSNSNKTTCPLPPTSPEIVPIVGNLTFHSLATIITGACAVFSFLVIAVLVGLHAFNYTNRIQQRQVIRIVLLVPWVSFFCFLTVWQEEAGEYLLGSLDFGCAVALSAFLLLMCDYVLASPDGYHELLEKGMTPSDDTKGKAWFKRAWYMVLQFIPTSLIIWAATCITLATDTYCAASNKPHFAHIWITVFKTLVTTWAVIADLKMYGMQKAVLKPQKMLLKFAAFKGIIGLNALQTFIINILVGAKTLHPTSHLSYDDIRVALPSLILGLEMPLFAILICLAFPASPYYKSHATGDDSDDENNTQVTPAAGPFVAIFEALNITDLLSCFVRGPMRLVKEQQWGIRRQQSWSLASPAAEGGRMKSVRNVEAEERDGERRERRHRRKGSQTREMRRSRG